MNNIKVTIKGISPLLMHRFGADQMTRVQEGGQVHAVNDREKDAESSAYRLPADNGQPGRLYIPSENLRRALVSASTFEKGKGRSTLAKFSAAAIFISPEVLDLGTSNYVIDSRPVVIPATKGRVIRHRPRLDSWSFQCTVQYDESLLTEKQLRAIFDHCGSKIGLLDYRPERKGPYGRFMITAWN